MAKQKEAKVDEKTKALDEAVKGLFLGELGA